MKIQGLAILSIIIILPMALLLNSYSSNQIKTLDFQISYDSKLKTATYDGIKTFQLNMSNSMTSDIVDSKMRDIKASIKTFYSSLASNFNMAGYGESVLNNYVPAVVYTLYDGYYIYSAYTNTLDDSEVFYDEATYKDGEMIYGLKPYIYYSCRYKRGADDFVITYSLDSYMTIQGTVNGKKVNDSGYLLTGVTKSGSDYYYRGIKIEPEVSNPGLVQNVYVPKDGSGTGNKRVTFNNTILAGSIKQYQYKKVNGVKYYIDDSNNVFSMLNDNRVESPAGTANADSIRNNRNGIRYYEEAYNFTNRVKNDYNLLNLKSNEAVDMNGQPITTFTQGIKIFGELDSASSTFLEDENSYFNLHRKEVIRNAIETNLMTAIANYNNVSTSGVNFAMPKLKDYEWESLTDNVSMITFLQGLSIGGKIYSGYAIVENDITEDFVSEDSIYISNNGQYYRITDPVLVNGGLSSNAIGIYNVDFERRTALATAEDAAGNDLKKNIYYYPKEDSASYSSIINLNSGGSFSSVSEFLKDAAGSGSGTDKYKLAQLYYTALGRERYGMYRVYNNMTEMRTKDLLN